MEPQTSYWGAADIRSAEPSITVHHDVVYQPLHPLVLYDQHLDWGVYSSIGQRVDEAAPRRFPTLTLLGQSEWKVLAPPRAARTPERTYVYGGVLIPHYGHFLCTSLSRLWSLAEHVDEDAKVVLHAPRPLGELAPFVRDLLAAAGLPPERVAVFHQPTWIERLIVPAQGLVEQAYAHSIMRDFFWRTGDALAGSAKPSGRSSRPVYLSKSSLDQGVTRIRNEGALCGALERLNVEVVHPEQMSVCDQATLFRSDRAIIAQAGSATHTCAFARAAGRRILFSFEALNTCQLLIDRLCWPDVVHLRPTGFANLGGGRRFGTEYELHDPPAVARALLEHV